MKNIIFVRHSEVIKPYQHCYNGHLDIPLSPKGKMDAKNLAQELEQFSFDIAFCSDLVRAKETLQAFNIQCSTIYTKALREKSWGENEGLSFQQITKKGIMYHNFEQWIDALGGENQHEFSKKLIQYFKKTILKSQGNTILIVTHAGVIYTLLSYINQITLEEAFNIQIPYTGYYQVSL